MKKQLFILILSLLLCLVSLPLYSQTTVCNQACLDSCSDGGGDCSGCCITSGTPVPGPTGSHPVTSATTNAPTLAPTPVPTKDPETIAAESALSAAQQEEAEAQQAYLDALAAGDNNAIIQAKNQLNTASAHAVSAAGNYQDALVAIANSPQAANTASVAVTANQSEGNSVPVGDDPVMIATGIFTTRETDIDYVYGALSINITRNYLGSSITSLSFGSCWNFNLGQFEMYL